MPRHKKTKPDDHKAIPSNDLPASAEQVVKLQTLEKDIKKEICKFLRFLSIHVILITPLAFSTISGNRIEFNFAAFVNCYKTSIMQRLLLILPEVVLTVAAKYVMDIYFFFSLSYVLQKLEPLQSVMDYITEQKAKETIANKTMTIKKLRSFLYYSDVLTTLTTALWSLGAMYYTSLETIIRSLVSGTFELSRQIQNTREERSEARLQQQLTYQERLLHWAAKSVPCKIANMRGIYANSGYFVIVFEQDKHARIFKDSCLRSHLPIELYRGDMVVIRATAITRDQANKIHQQFEKYFEKEAANKEFIKRVRTLVAQIRKTADDVMIVRDYDAQNEPVISVRFLLPNTIDVARVKAIFHGTVEPFDNDYYEVATDQSNYYHAGFAQALLDEIRESREPRIASDAEDQKSPSGANRITLPSISELKESTPLKSITPPSRRVEWEGFSYDSKRNDNRVYPMMLYGQQHSDQNYARARFFVTNQLGPQQFPKTFPQDVAQRIDRLVQEAKLVPAKGQQGFKFCRERVKSQLKDGAEFDAACKGKFINDHGFYGNFGIFAESIPSKSDSSGQQSVLLVVKGYTLDRHKKRRS